uniref:Integrase catalytic domain-containing protein n=1 Tax=Fagus sylvatica TaxID=28930 RepID=A0A2N9EFL0_FAGSY
MYQDLYTKLSMGEAELSSFTSPIFGFSGEPVVPLGKTVLLVLAGPINLQTEFIVVKASSPYNAIMGHDWLHRMKAIPSTLHQKLRFPTKTGIMELNGDQVAAKQCVLAAFKQKGAAERAIASTSDKQSRRFHLVVLEEVEHLLASGAIREVQYPVWLSNTVVVKKKNGKWRVGIDFTDLNKACPKDPFPLPRIDQLVDSASGHARLSFLDAFQGYHQIPMNVADQEKTAFITPRGTYYYKVMLFGLKNAGATYQGMVTKMFGHMIGKTVEVYIDDMLVKSLREENHVANLLRVFDILRENRICLNASKCTFGMSSDKFLGHVVSRRGIKANPDQIAALVDLAEPRNIKQGDGIFVNGASNSKGSGAGVVLVSPEGLVLEQAVRLKFSASNNEAEYEALLIGLRTAKRLGACHLQPNWMDLILSYLVDSKLPEDRKEAKMIKQMTQNFLFEIHEGIYGSHTGGRSLAHKAISQGYWWPYMQADALKYWGLDIVGPLAQAPGNKKFLITATDYFIKWIEAEPLSNIRDVDVKRFFWKNVITRFGIPWAAISDNGTQFESRLFKGFCSDLGIKNFFSSPGYPQSNGQAEASSKIILNGIKKKLEEAKGKWVEELPSVLWTHRTTARKSTGEAPFALTYGVEAVIPLEVSIPTTRTTDFAVETNEDNLRKDLDLLEERRDLAIVRLASYQ